jgi:hypothetical protein
VNALQIYQLRLALLDHSYLPVPCRNGVAAFTPCGSVPPTEGAVLPRFPPWTTSD